MAKVLFVHAALAFQKANLDVFQKEYNFTAQQHVSMQDSVAHSSLKMKNSLFSISGI